MDGRVERWLKLMGGSDGNGVAGRDDAAREMVALGPDVVVPLMAGSLGGPDPDARCAAIRVVELVAPTRAAELVAPALLAAEVRTRLTACGVLGRPEARTAVGPLLDVLRDDPDPGVRSAAARALGHIGHPSAIPALLRAVDADRVVDELGHTPSDRAALALADLLARAEPRARVTDAGPHADVEPDREQLRVRAEELYRHWSTGPN